MAEVCQFAQIKQALGFADEERMLAENCEHLLQMCEMGILGSTVDQNVVEEHDDKLSKQRFEDLVHCGLKCCRCIRQPK